MTEDSTCYDHLQEEGGDGSAADRVILVRISLVASVLGLIVAIAYGAGSSRSRTARGTDVRGTAPA